MSWFDDEYAGDTFYEETLNEYARTPVLGTPAEAGQLLLWRRMELLKKYLYTFETRRRILLDYGCGNGVQTRLAAELFRHAIGVDVVDYGWAPSRDVIFLHMPDAAHVPVASDCADTITAWCVLEHVRREREAMREIKRLLRPGGELFVTVPNRWWPFEVHGICGWSWRAPLVSWLPRGIHSRISNARIYTKRDLRGLLEAHGFRVISMEYVRASMDTIRWAGPLHRLALKLVERDRQIPVLATEIFAYAVKD
jgi:SAM-dependent methyltransferase